MGDGDDRHAVVSGEVENHLGGGRCLCSLPPQKPKKSCLKIRVAGEVLPFSLAYDLTSQQMAEPPGGTWGHSYLTFKEHSMGTASCTRFSYLGKNVKMPSMSQTHQ